MGELTFFKRINIYFVSDKIQDLAMMHAGGGERPRPKLRRLDRFGFPEGGGGFFIVILGPLPSESRTTPRGLKTFEIAQAKVRISPGLSSVCRVRTKAVGFTVNEVVKETVRVLASPVNGTDCWIVPSVNLVKGS